MIRREHHRFAFLEGDAQYVGERAYYLDEITLLNADGIRIGAGVGFGAGCWLNGYGGIQIGQDTLIGPGCMIHSANHAIAENGTPLADEWEPRETVIGANCWLGMGVIVVPGASIFPGTIIGAGAVVSGNVSGRVKGPRAS